MKLPRISFKRADLERLLIAGAAALVLLLAAFGSPSSPVDNYSVPYSEVLPDTSVSTATGPTQYTTVYYTDSEGYLVPVSRQVSKTDGIAKATLSLMVANDTNDLTAARLGLSTVIPDATTFDLDISGGKARIDLSSNVLSLPDAESESHLVSSVVATLTQFDSVNAVEFLVGGQKRAKLTHGTDISGEMTGAMVNLESVDTGATLTGAELVRLYFPSANGRVLIPVTRAVFSPADLNTAILELCKGPRDESGLRKVLPGGTGLIDVSLDKGVAKINFTKEFQAIAESSDGGQQALRALMLTCMQYPGVSKVELLVDGKAYTPQAVDKPTFINSVEQAAVQFEDVIEID